MIQRLVLSFRNPHSYHSNATKKAIFWLKVHYKLMTNQALLNALAQDAKLVLSFTTPQTWWLGMIHIMLYALYASLDHAHQDLSYWSLLLLWYDLLSVLNCCGIQIFGKSVRLYTLGCPDHFNSKTVGKVFISYPLLRYKECQESVLFVHFKPFHSFQCEGCRKMFIF